MARREAAPGPQGRILSGPYRVLFEYLEKRYADRVVLTFAQIEDLLGDALPADAYSDDAWWTKAAVDIGHPMCSDSWLLAHRSARPNLPARVVVFARG